MEESHPEPLIPLARAEELLAQAVGALQSAYESELKRREQRIERLCRVIEERK